MLEQYFSLPTWLILVMCWAQLKIICLRYSWSGTTWRERGLFSAASLPTFLHFIVPKLSLLILVLAFTRMPFHNLAFVGKYYYMSQWLNNGSLLPLMLLPTRNTELYLQRPRIGGYWEEGTETLQVIFVSLPRWDFHGESEGKTICLWKEARLCPYGVLRWGRWRISIH